MYIQYNASQPPPPSSGEQRKSVCQYATYMYMYYTHVYNRNIPIYFSFRSISMSGLESLVKNSTRYMYPIRASQSTGDEDISRGPLGSTYN